MSTALPVELTGHFQGHRGAHGPTGEPICPGRQSVCDGFDVVGGQLGNREQWRTIWHLQPVAGLVVAEVGGQLGIAQHVAAYRVHEE